MDKYKGHENPEKAKADAERARSGAWGTHQDQRNKRARTRSAAIQRAIRVDSE